MIAKLERHKVVNVGYEIVLFTLLNNGRSLFTRESYLVGHTLAKVGGT